VRIALVTDTYTPQVNGVTTVIHRIVDVVDHAGWCSAIVAPHYPSSNGSAPANELRVASIPMPSYPAIRLSLPSYRRLARFLDRHAPDVVHVATEGPLGLLGRIYTQRRNLSLVTSFHTNFPQYVKHYGAPRLAPAVWRWLRWFHAPALLTHTPSIALQNELLSRGLTQVTVWGWSVDSEVFHPRHRSQAWRQSIGVPDDAVIVLHVGRLAAEKNLEVLIHAWRTARNAVGDRVAFVIAGDGPLGPELERQMPWAHRLGFLDRSELAAVYASSELCTLPSHTETCGLVALEAMASGLPVIAAGAGGFRESISHEVNGLLVPHTDARAFATAVIHLATRVEQRRRMAKDARAFAEERDVSGENAVLLQHYEWAAERSRGVETCVAA
jgi:glycosyltransferase involved in cell wall biosynthesis